MTFNVNEYMNKVRNYGKIKPSDIQIINSALPNTRHEINKPEGTMYVSFDYTQLQKVMYHLTESGMAEMFLNSSIKGATVGKTVAKEVLKSFDPHYASRKPESSSKGMPYVLKRNKNPSTGMSIYRLIAENLNITIDDTNGNVIGFVGEDLGTPLEGSRGGSLAQIVEKTIKKKRPSMPSHTPVAAGFKYLDKGRVGQKANESGDFKPSTYSAVGTQNKGIVNAKGRKSRKAKEYKMQPVNLPRQVPFLNPWSKATLKAIFDELMGEGIGVWR